MQDDGKYASRLSDALRSEPKANAERFRELMQSSVAKPQGGLCAGEPQLKRSDRAYENVSKSGATACRPTGLDKFLFGGVV